MYKSRKWTRLLAFDAREFAGFMNAKHGYGMGFGRGTRWTLKSGKVINLWWEHQAVEAIVYA